MLREALEGICSLERRPQRATQVLVEQVPQRHGLDPLGINCLGSLSCFQPFPHFNDVRRMAPDRPEVIELSVVLGGVRINFRSIVQMKRDCLVIGGKFESGELAKQHFGRERLVVIIDEVVEPKTVPREADFTIWVPVQPRRQQGDQGVGSIHARLSAGYFPSRD